MSRDKRGTITVNPGICYCWRDGKVTVHVSDVAGPWPREGTRVADFDEIKHLLSDRPLHRPPKYRRPE